jgi:hypothetical protein
MQPLAVHDIVRECWAFLLERSQALAHAAALPFVLLLLLSVVARAMTAPAEIVDPALPPEAMALPDGVAVLVAMKLLEGLVLASVAVALHRAVLMDEPLPTLLRIDARSLRYALRMAGLVLVSMVPVMVIVAAAMILGGGGMAAVQLAVLPSMFAMLFVLCRLHPVLAATAIDVRTRFAEAWERTKGQGFRLVLGAIILLAPLMIGGALVLLILGDRLDGVPVLQNLPQAVALLTDLVESALLAVYFSLTWRRLSRSDQPLASTPV